ncbi:carboxymuconolactone decarboxylase family protein [Campylobacter gracilis]|uniref:Alkylhydroperoxidase AhpD family core domain protein n=1 Tax=Campylobacter gracilis RM3268 TaxID=553220 RepID=C8PDW2_9BACT|nr:carboxymuconolactone decarboxylase family protein [Campylobacter gracilis]AKT91626.1 carboxymuconolactone decarboxylase family protein [Campylobacter gracilis]EEV19034.1 alkylhydroperoxidase AhpD family core domain protein [Campylobacter gracilis RM3268]UEB46166.1 carboxymuconolactone decarboxylase family protein [Campylobacter gracilis]SUW77926.1 carboxymuconolactone decarboxylase [Campylobacter gracilis]
MVNFNELPHAAKLNGALSDKQLALVSVAAYAAAGDADKLKGALQNALKAGLSVSQIREALSHQSAYIGFPMGLNGLIVFNNLVKEREAAGIKDEAGKDASPVAADSDFYALGEQTQKYIFGSDYSGTVLFDAPAADHGLKAYLFGYLFSRDNLGFLEREIITVSTLAALNGVNMQLKSHLIGARNLGVTGEQFERIFKILGECVGEAKAQNARDVLKSL